MPSSTSLRARSGVVTGVKPSRISMLDGVLLQGQFQQHGLVFEEVKAVAGHVGAAFEIDQIELFGQFDVIQRLEIELRQRRLAAEQLPGSTLSSTPIGASGCERLGIER